MQSKVKKFLTLNTHSWQGTDGVPCLQYVSEMIRKEQPDVIAFQEVNQRADGEKAGPGLLEKSSFFPSGFDIGRDNWALCLIERLRDMGITYAWSWAYTHIGYGVWEEGIAVLSRTPVLDLRIADISSPELPEDSWRRRRVLGIQNELGWFCSVHAGWWKDTEDPFQAQWERIKEYVRSMKGRHYLLGDFNNPAQTRCEGYDLMLHDGWEDCYNRAEARDMGITVPQEIDGWREQQVRGLRMDLCMTDFPGKTLSSSVVFNGAKYPVVSDHFGVLTEEEIEE